MQLPIGNSQSNANELLENHLEYSTLVSLREGDHNAFQAIYDQYKRQLTANVLRLVRSTDLTEEVIQDTFVALWESRERIDVSRPIQAYLYAIAANKTKNVFRRVVSNSKYRDELLNSFEESYNPIMDSIFRKEYRQQLDTILSKLSPQQEKVYRLCKLEHKSYQEASRILNLSEGTINVHIREANKKLKLLVAENVDIIFCLLFFLQNN